MFCAICAGPPPPSAKNSSAPGARSWTISIMAVPSLPLLRPPQATSNAPPACPGRIVTCEGTSPVACCAASVSTPSEITPTPMPVPSTSCVPRAAFARWAASPSLVSILWLAAGAAGSAAWPAATGCCVRMRGWSAARIHCTSARSASGSRPASGSRARMAR